MTRWPLAQNGCQKNDKAACHPHRRNSNNQSESVLHSTTLGDRNAMTGWRSQRRSAFKVFPNENSVIPNDPGGK